MALESTKRPTRGQREPLVSSRSGGYFLGHFSSCCLVTFLLKVQTWPTISDEASNLEETSTHKDRTLTVPDSYE